MTARAASLPLTITALFVAVITLASACSGGSKGTAVTPRATTATTPTLQATTATTSTPPTAVPPPTLGPDEATASALGPNAPMVAYSDPGGRYTVTLPRAWTQVASTNMVTASLPGAPLTNVAIYCQPGFTGDQLEAQDERIANNVASRTILGRAPYPVAGTNGTIVTSVTNLATTALRATSVYFEGKGCGWRIQLTTITTDDYAPLLQRVAESFKFT